MSNRASLRQRLRVFGDAVEQWVFPTRCIVCGGPGTGLDLCTGCARELPWNRDACTRCAQARGESMDVCGACLTRAPPWRRAVCPFRYAFPVDRLLQQLKFGHRVSVGRVLGALTAEWLACETGALPDVVVPVPLHPRRERARRYNQSLELARPIAARLGVALAPRLCRRRRATREQTGLEGDARRRNVRDAFVVSGECAGQRVAIVDDVVTTGSTAAELTRVLLAAGARSVDVWAVARTL